MVRSKAATPLQSLLEVWGRRAETRPAILTEPDFYKHQLAEHIVELSTTENEPHVSLARYNTKDDLVRLACRTELATLFKAKQASSEGLARLIVEGTARHTQVRACPPLPPMLRPVAFVLRML